VPILVKTDQENNVTMRVLADGHADRRKPI